VKLTIDQFLQTLKAIKEKLEIDKKEGLLNLLSKEGIKSPIVICSEEHTRVKRLNDWFVANFFKDQKELVSSYFGSELTNQAKVNSILSTLANPSLFAPLQLVIIHSVDSLKLALLKTLLEAVTQSNTTLTIFTVTSTNEVSKLQKDLAKHGSIVELPKLGPAQVKRFIVNDIKKLGAKIENDALELLVSYLGNNISELEKALEKLCLLVGPQETITSALVKTLSFSAKDISSFELVKQLGKKNIFAAVDISKSLFNQGLHPLQILSFLSRSFRILLALKEKNNNAAHKVHTELSNPWFVRQLSPLLNYFTTHDLISSIDLLKGLDFSLKDANVGDEAVFSIAMQRLAGRSFAK